MTNSLRDPPVFVATRLSIPGDPAEVAWRYREYGAGLLRRPGFGLMVTVRVAGSPGAYVTFVRWHRARDLLAGVHVDEVADVVRTLHGLAAADVEPELDRYVSVGRLPDRQHDRGDCLLLLHADVAGGPGEFEQSFGALVAECVHAPGFCGAELLRSTLRPHRYRGLVWWRNEQSCRRVTADEGFRARRSWLAETALIATEHSRCVARLVAPET